MDQINKKGILISLGITLLALTVLLFASLILRYAESSEERLAEFSIIDRVYNLDRSIQLSVAEMVNDITDWNFTLAPNRIIIRKTVWNFSDVNSTDSNWTVFISNLTFFKSYLDSMQSLSFLKVKEEFQKDPKYTLVYSPLQNFTTLYKPTASGIAFSADSAIGRYKFIIVLKDSPFVWINISTEAFYTPTNIPLNDPNTADNVNVVLVVNGTLPDGTINSTTVNVSVDVYHDAGANGWNRSNDLFPEIIIEGLTTGSGKGQIKIYTGKFTPLFVETYPDTWGIIFVDNTGETFNLIADIDTNVTIEKVISDRIPVNTTSSEYGITQRSRVRIV